MVWVQKTVLPVAGNMLTVSRSQTSLLHPAVTSHKQITWTSCARRNVCSSLHAAHVYATMWKYGPLLLICSATRQQVPWSAELHFNGIYSSVLHSCFTLYCALTHCTFPVSYSTIYFALLWIHVLYITLYSDRLFARYDFSCPTFLY